MPQHMGRRWISGKAVAIGGCASLLGGFALAGQATPGLAATTAGAAHPLMVTALPVIQRLRLSDGM